MQAAAILRLQRAAAALGLTPVDVIPPPHDSRLDDMETRSSRLVEDDTLAWHQVGEAEPWGEPVAFLDGIQRYGIFAYDGCSPVAWAMVAAAVRERRDRRFRSAAAARRNLVIGRRETLDRLADIVGEREPVPIPDDVPPHPLREMQAIRRVVDTVRGHLEIEVGSAFRRAAAGWLLVDGSLGVRPAWAGTRE